jgi:hypothetical protein
MKKNLIALILISLTLAFLLVFTGCSGVSHQTKDGGGTENMKEAEENFTALELPAYQYVEGWYNKDPELMGTSIHPALAKRHIEPGAENQLKNVDLGSLLDIAKSYGGPGGPGRQIDIEILDKQKQTASVKVTSNAFVDYIHLGYYENKWWIINVLWEYKSDSKPALDETLKKAVSNPVYDYIEGWYDKDEERIAHGIHPDLAKRNIDTNQADGVFNYTRESLLAVVQQYGGTNGSRTIDIEFLDVQDTIASVKATSDAFIDYIHLGLFDGEWKIVNVMWEFK